MDSNAALKAKIDKAIAETIESSRKKIVERIESQWESCIDQFYSSYNPTILYHRTRSTYRASEAYGDLGNHTFNPIGDNAAEIGIRIDSENIGDPYHADPEWVFTRTFEKGIHGFTRTEAIEWSNYYVIVNGKKYFYWRRPKTIPKKMDQPPKSLMDKWFKRFKKNELKAIVNECFKDAMSANF